MPAPLRAATLRRFCFVLLPLLALVWCLTAWYYHGSRSRSLAALDETTRLRLDMAEREVRHVMRDGATDVMLMSRQRELMMQADRPPEQWGTVAEHFMTWLANKPVYDQMRLLDNQGREQLRVDLASGVPSIASPEQLLDRRQLGYFQRGRELGAGRVYVSPLGLGAERGLPDYPPKPVLRFAAPLFGDSGQRRGVLVFSYLARHLFERLAEVRPPGTELALLDGRGLWLAGGRLDELFALQQMTGRTLPERDAELWSRLLQDERGLIERPEGTWMFSWIRPLALQNYEAYVAGVTRQGDDDYRWLLLLRLDDSTRTARLAQSGRDALIFGGVLSLAALLLAGWTVRRLGRVEDETLDHYRSFDEVPLAVAVFNDERRLLYRNPVWAQFAAGGEDWRSIFATVDVPTIEALLTAPWQPDEIRQAEVRCRDGAGELGWYQLAVAQRGEGENRHLLVTLNEVDAIHRQCSQAGRRLGLLDSVIAACADPLLAIDQGFRVTVANPALRQLFQRLYGSSPVPGDGLVEWLDRHVPDRGGLLLHFSAALRGEPATVRLTLGEEKRLFDIAFAVLPEDEDRLGGAVMYARDVTEAARLQANLARKEELFRAVFDGNLEAVLVFESIKDESGSVTDFRLAEVNATALRRSGQSREQLLGQRLDALAGLCDPRLRPRLIEAVRQGQGFSEECRLDDGESDPMWREIQVAPMGWGLAMTCTDIGKRKSIESALEKSERLQRAILDSAPYCILSVDLDGILTRFNRAAELMLGYRAEELVGRSTPGLFYDAEELAAVVESARRREGSESLSISEVIAAACRDNTGQEWTFVHRDGHHFPVMLNVSELHDADGAVVGHMAIAYDISRQKAAERERDRLHAVVESMPDMVGMATPDGQWFYLNPAGRRLRGIAADAPLDRLPLYSGYPDWAYQLVSRIGIPQALSGQPWEGETQCLNAEGRVIDVRQLIVAPSTGRNRADFIAIFSHDLTEVRAMETKMIESEAMLNSVLESVSDAIVTVDEDGLVQMLNPAVRDIFGYSLHKVMSRELGMLLAPGSPGGGSFPRLLEQCGGCADKPGLQLEVQGLRSNGERFPLALSISEIRLGNRHLFTAVMRDISAHKAVEAKLVENIEELEFVQAALNRANEELISANREFNRMAHQDGLTGVANRRQFDRLLHEAWQHAVQRQRPLALLLVDVDHFKRYNDAYGHQIGDECLVRVARVLVAALDRPEDVVARYGGEEFALLLADADRTVAIAVAARIRRLLAEEAIPHQDSPTAACITISLGIAIHLPGEEGTPEHLVASADQALYAAKANGRDQARIAGE
ncbi:diguanylate cyclase domain-containing protein [Chitinimonas lacunae]|uniref:Diguanylate cyclase domain-containing protein n=1 Tax=Chitinimonas lacunae TaxID=1963018 RepID=A0ABV8MLC7_9NEIS